MGNAVSLGGAPRTAVAPQSKAAEPLRDHQPQSAGTEHRPSEPSWESALGDPITFATLWLAVATTALGIFTYRLWRATITLATDTKASGDTQANKMERSVEEAAKAATAMERIAESMALNTAQVVRSVEITASIAELQERVGKFQTRAYVSILIGHAVYQDAFNLFAGHLFIRNTGNTPAKKLRWRVGADILPVPIPKDFRYSLSEEISGLDILYPQQDGTMGAVVPERVPESEVSVIKGGFPKGLFVWGALSYEDVFGATHRCTFAQQLYWKRAGPMREDGVVPEEVRGFFLRDHNCAN